MTSFTTRFCVPDLKKERLNCTFNKEEVTNILDGGKNGTEHRRKIRDVFLGDPAYEDEIPPEYLSHEDMYGNELRKGLHTLLKMKKENISISDFEQYGPRDLMKDGNPFMVHTGMFYSGLIGQATPEQQKKWLDKAVGAEIIGTWAQTEIGHGTNVRGLETMATFDESTKEFVIHSPTITATKWWPGGLGKTSSYAIVMAQLYIKGKCYGPHPFMVQLRDEENHRSMPGVTLGEIGPRVGLNGNDNGFLRFNNYRIPRTNMLMKYSQVLEDGTYVRPKHGKIAYVTITYTRVTIIYYVCKHLQNAVTIATRYSAVRHQSELVPGEPEPQILEYQTQQYKLIPQISSVFALLFAAQSCRDTYTEVIASVDRGVVSQLAELHALSSGLKAISATDATKGIEICRLACGGHGYIASANFARLYGATTAANTYDGENTVLWLQVARYLIKSFKAGQRGEHLQGSVAYLQSKPSVAAFDNLSNEGLLEAFRVSVVSMITEASRKLERLSSSGMAYHHAWNNCSVSLVKCAQAHTRYYLCEGYVRNVRALQVSPGVRVLMENLCRLYLLYQVSLNEGLFLKAGVLSTPNIATLEEEMTDLLAQLRPQAVSIVDAFDIDDQLLNSTLGAWDGNVYQRLYDEAQKSPLNKTDVPKAYYQHLRPLMKSSLKSSL